jgi:maltose alpha-D-glucosyltransferase / alpha-amylase
MKVLTLLLLMATFATGVLFLHCNGPADQQAPVNTLSTFVHAVAAERKNAGKSPAVDTANFWFKNSFIYTLDIEVFQDSDEDGTGDIKGLISRLDYIRNLGADAIWLAPFQPTPNQDDGYDISDFYGVDARLGSMSDFDLLVAEAHKRGLRIIMDLVINHTSNQHPWFLQAQDAHNPYHQWYVWSTEKPENMHIGMVFPGIQESIWTWDSRAGAYYYHRFYQFQPDLNMQHPPVWAEMKRIDSFWMAKGVDGFRLDAVPFIIEVPKTRGERFDHQFQLLAEMRQKMEAAHAGSVILGEANVMPGETKDFFGSNGERMNMMFNFYVNQYLFYAMASGHIDELQKALEKTKAIPAQVQWAQFLRNHDEIDLGRLTEKQRDEVYKAFGPEKNMQLYDRGIRRRLAPMLGNDRKRLELAYSVMLALPSTPVLRYGEELGMGDNLALKERESVRTPMQWNDSIQGGFSMAAKTVRPVIDTGQYGYHTLNIQQQLNDSTSFLRWLMHMIKLRKSLPAIGWGSWKVLEVGPQVLALQYEWEGQSVITLHNFSPDSREVTIGEQADDNLLHNLLNNEEIKLSGKASHHLTLKGYEYRWYRQKKLPAINHK